MKKLLFSVIAFALITTSCNKYKDDFKALNARLDALAAQVAGVPALSTSLTSLAAQITALQTAVSGLPTNASITALQTALTALATQVTGINTTLNVVATNVANIPGLLTTLTNLINTNQTGLLAAIAAAQTAITDAITNNNTVLAATIQAQITALQIAVNASITDAQNAIIGDNANQTVLLQALLAQLQTAVAIANAQLATLVSSNNIFVGDLIINDEATLTFAESLGAKVRAITGNVTIDASTFSAGQMTRLKNVTNNTIALPPPQQNPFIGTIVGNLTLSGSQAVDLSKLVVVSGDGVTTGSVTVTGGAFHDLSALVSVKKDYSISGGDVSDDALLNVGGNLNLSYPAAYSYPNLTTVGGATGITATDNASVSAISFPALNSVIMINGNTPTWGVATSIVINRADLVSLTAPFATTVTLNEPSYPGAFTLSAIRGVTLNMPAVTVAGVLTIGFGTNPTGTNPTLNLNSLTSATGGVVITTAGLVTGGTVNLAVYSANTPLQIDGPLTQTLPVYTVNTLSSNSIQTLTMPVYRASTNVGTQFVTLLALRTLTIGDVRNTITEASFVNTTTLRNLTATSSVYGVQINLTGMANLLTVSTAGLLQQLSLVNDGSLTSVTTAGNMDYLTLNNDDALTSVTVGHNYVASGLGQGTHITILDCDALGSFSTATITGRLKTLDIEENNVLSTLNFSSLIVGDNITAGVVSMTIFNNKLAATYTPSIFATNSAPIIAQSGLASIKAYALNILGGAPYVGSFINFGFFNGAPGVGGPYDNSIATMDADATAYSVASGDANPGPNSFVQRLGDNNGQGGSQTLGSRINVARELGYVQ